MAYERITYTFPTATEYEFHWAGRYGAKGEKRAPRQKATPEQIKKQNQHMREKKVRHLIMANFSPGDLWCTLKYRKGSRPPLEKVLKDFKRFRENLRRAYRKEGAELRYIYRIEIGKRGGIHIHFLVNRVDDLAEKPITTLWGRIRDGAGVYYTPIHEDGDYQELAEYITKKPSEEIAGQLELFPEEDREHLIRYSGSRNLIRPEPERKHCGRLTMKKILTQGPQPSSPEYFIDKSTVRQGINRVTGYSYLYYTERRKGGGG